MYLLKDQKKAHVLITGGSGLIGQRLTKLLVSENYHVTQLTRIKNSLCGVKTYLWDYRKGILEKDALTGVDYIIHLAGAGIADEKWTAKRKKIIINSRKESTRFLYEKVLQQNINLKGFISASGINYYGAITSDAIHTESDPPALDFTGVCVKTWEKAVDLFLPVCRIVKLRTGVVLSKDGGALPKIAAPIGWGVGAALGSGKQWVPWIHIDDLCRMFLHALENNEIQNAYNAIAPEHITNKGLTKAVAKALKMPLFMPNIPEFILRKMVGELAVLVLQGSRASSEKITQTGFEFQYGTLEKALKQIYR
jgi:uncharacterized protein (TIGR01777 family)